MSKILNQIASSIDPDEMARDEPSHLDLHCLCKYLFQSLWAKRAYCQYCDILYPYHAYSKTPTSPVY